MDEVMRINTARLCLRLKVLPEQLDALDVQTVAELMVFSGEEASKEALGKG